jgi:transcriptional regulator GlxA family with amidase domain
MVGCRAKSWLRAVEYIQDQLDTDLTASGIAQAVGLSPDHFTRLFKESTGQSPHRYVVEARVRKAKEATSPTLIPEISGNFTAAVQQRKSSENRSGALVPS